MSTAKKPDFAVVHGDCLDVMRRMRDASVDAIVSDPPYELSNDGKASAARVLLELVLPQNAKVQAERGGIDHLPSLVAEVLRLCDGRLEPRPTTAVKVGAVALDDDSASGKHDVENATEGPVGTANSDAGLNIEAEQSEHLGCFLFEAADLGTVLDAFNRAGCGFLSGRVGVGFGVPAASLPSLLRRSGAIDIGDESIRPQHNPLSTRVGALLGAEQHSVAALHLSGGSEDLLPASAALILLATLKSGTARLVRAFPAARGLPPVLQARRVRVVSSSTRRTFTFDLLVHPQNVTSTGFMGKGWDGSKIAYDVELWREALRIAKPGAHLLAFGGTRTFHRLAVAIEDAGWEVRDCLSWLYGSGFPKSHNLDGAWEGWGTALKPAFEPIILARKPLVGTVAANVQAHGTGALNVDGCRIGTSKRVPGSMNVGNLGRNGVYGHGDGAREGDSGLNPNVGRWPANVVLDEEAARALDQMTGMLTSGKVTKTYDPTLEESVALGKKRRSLHPGAVFSDSGGASRFFYVAKASRSEREAGLREAGLREAETQRYGEQGQGPDPKQTPREPVKQRNTHPTVKPVALMRWLCRLVTPPGGVVLDPFCGSGTTGVAAVREGFRFVGIEREAEYVEIARARVSHAAEADG